jgi:sugar lactone lactonase YvrE
VPLGAGTGNVTVSVNNGILVSGPVFTYQLSAVVTTLAGSKATGSANGKGAAASFSSAYGIAIDAAGNLYVSDKNDYLIRKITSDGVVTTLAGSGTYGTADGTGTTASFSEPVGITVDVAGNVYVTDFVSNSIWKITPSGLVTTIQVATNQTGYTQSFFTPVGIAIAASGNVYVSDSGFGLITKLDFNGTATIFTGNGQLGLTDGPFNIASFDSPQGIKLDKNENLYIADGNAIGKVDKGGNVTTLTGVKAAGFADGNVNIARFNGVRDLVVDKDGNIYAADNMNRLIRKITPDGIVSTVAGNMNTFISIDGIGSNAGFSGLNGICIDNNGNLYVTDSNEIRKIIFE